MIQTCKMYIIFKTCQILAARFLFLVGIFTGTNLFERPHFAYRQGNQRSSKSGTFASRARIGIQSD